MKLPRLPDLIRSLRFEIVSFVVGFVILAFELTAARIVAPYLGDTIYSWTSIIGVILAALAYGYTRGGILADRRQKPGDIPVLLCATAVAITIVNLAKDSVLSAISNVNLPLQLQALLASIFLFALPTLLLGLTSPYLARLSITDVKSSGQRLSRIDAAGTIGSLTGTFATGFFLFGLIGSGHLLTVLAICLVAVSFIITTRQQRLIRLGLIGAVALLGGIAPGLALAGLVAQIDTTYSRVIVRDLSYDGRPARVLQIGDDHSLQSGVYLDGDPSPVFSYTRGFGYLANLRPDAKRSLVIGGGAFTFPAFLARSQPNSKVEAVEIDPQLKPISQQYFGFVQPRNLAVINADGRQYLNTTNQHYDMIFLDAFNSSVPPFQLYTTEAAQQMSRSLKSDGIVVSNVISAATGPNSTVVQYIYSTFANTFSHVTVYRVTPQQRTSAERQNLLLVASNQPLSKPDLRNIGHQNPEFAAMEASALKLEPSHKKLLTDDFAPVEQLAGH